MLIVSPICYHPPHECLHRFTEHVRAAVAALANAGVFPTPPDLSRIVVEPPREASHGDLATNAAMALAKDAGLKPRDLAEKIAAELRKLPEVTKSRHRRAGLHQSDLDPAVWQQALAASSNRAPRSGGATSAAGEKVNVEYVSANPTGPMHVGHCRGAVFGDALANLLAAAGFAVTREYYINDAGAQVDVLARSAFLRYREALGETIGEIPDGLYPGDYLKPVGQALAAEHGDKLKALPEAQWLPIVRSTAIAMMMAMIRDDLAALNVKHDVFVSERSLIAGSDQVGATIAALRAQGRGLRRAAAAAERRAGRGLGGPRADAVPRHRLRRRRRPAAEEIRRQLHLLRLRHRLSQDKFERGFHDMIDVWGADHGGYVKRMKAAVQAVSGGKAELDVKICQLVKLLRGGEK